MRQRFVPAKQLRDWGCAVVLDTAGWPHEVTAGHLTIVERWFCLTADVLAEEPGRALVRFADRGECWVPEHPVWAFEPMAADRVVGAGAAALSV